MSILLRSIMAILGRLPVPLFAGFGMLVLFMPPLAAGILAAYGYIGARVAFGLSLSAGRWFDA